MFSAKSAVALVASFSKLSTRHQLVCLPRLAPSRPFSSAAPSSGRLLVIRSAVRDSEVGPDSSMGKKDKKARAGGVPAGLWDPPLPSGLGDSGGELPAAKKRSIGAVAGSSMPVRPAAKKPMAAAAAMSSEDEDMPPVKVTPVALSLDRPRTAS